MRNMLVNEESKESVLNLFERILNIKLKEAELKQAEWDTKGLKPKRDEIIEAFKHLDSFDTYIKSNFESKENFELLIIKEIKIRMEELLEGFHGVGRPMIIPCIKSGPHNESKKQVKDLLHTRLNSHDNELLYLFDKFIVPDLVWSEELFEILAYLKGKTYKPSSLTNELRTIFIKAYVILEENLQEPEWYCNAKPLTYYWHIKSDLEEIYYDDYLPIQKLLSFIPNNSLDCHISYCPNYINETWAELQEGKVKQAIYKAYYDLLQKIS